jgi:hypothetical protein
VSLASLPPSAVVHCAWSAASSCSGPAHMLALRLVADSSRESCPQVTRPHPGVRTVPTSACRIVDALFPLAEMCSLLSSEDAAQLPFGPAWRAHLTDRRAQLAQQTSTSAPIAPRKLHDLAQRRNLSSTPRRATRWHPVAKLHHSASPLAILLTYPCLGNDIVVVGVPFR